jgi:hypothetical protein
MNDDTDFALEVMKKSFGTKKYIVVNSILRPHIKIDKDQVVTFWGISDRKKEYLSQLAGFSFPVEGEQK